MFPRVLVVVLRHARARRRLAPRVVGPRVRRLPRAVRQHPHRAVAVVQVPRLRSPAVHRDEAVPAAG